jgi:hypothetical protein
VPPNLEKKDFMYSSKEKGRRKRLSSLRIYLGFKLKGEI